MQNEKEINVYLVGHSGRVGYYRKMDFFLGDGYQSYTNGHVLIGTHETHNEAKMWVRDHFRKCTEPFRATHVFRGLPLRSLTHTDGLLSIYKDAEGYEYRLPEGKVDRIPNPPRSGEVWRHIKAQEGEKGHLRYVDKQGSFYQHDTEMGFTRTIRAEDMTYDVLVSYVKVLNADGSPANV